MACGAGTTFWRRPSTREMVFRKSGRRAGELTEEPYFLPAQVRKLYFIVMKESQISNGWKKGSHPIDNGEKNYIPFAESHTSLKY